MTYRERRERRAERLRAWADKREARAAASFTKAHDAIAGIPAGQPILVGHHSERHHRRDLARHDSAMRAGLESADLAQSMNARADEIDRQAEHAIYNDDPDAIERLTEKLASLEAQRARVKIVNAAVRKEGLSSPVLTEAERAELLQILRLCPYHHCDTRGYPAYHLQNLGGNITRVRQRIAVLSGTPTPKTIWNNDGTAGPVRITPPPATAPARAGLEVIASMTTPSRPCKQPRPVWNVRGNFGPWRGLLTELGGSWYRGVFSFWEDPTAALEAALQERE